MIDRTLSRASPAASRTCLCSRNSTLLTSTQLGSMFFSTLHNHFSPRMRAFTLTMLSISRAWRSSRTPRHIELETIAQTWSEHCKHKTLTGKIRFGDEVIDNLLKSEIARVTRELDREFCVSVFEDNAGVIEGRAISPNFGRTIALAGPPRTIALGLRIGY